MSNASAVQEAMSAKTEAPIATWEVQQQLPKVAYGQGCYVFDTDGETLYRRLRRPGGVLRSAMPIRR